MSGAVVVFGLALAGLLLTRRPAVRVLGLQGLEFRGPRGRPPVVRGLSASSGAETLHEASIMVAQLASLLRAGRSPDQMWDQAAQTSPAEAADVLSAAARASAAGSPVSRAIREAAGLTGEHCLGPEVRSKASRWKAGRTEPTVVFRSVWSDVAGCLEISEHSGCPLAGVLERLSVQLEADADAAAARATALAGPRATTRILTVLPLVGLAMGALLGVDPLEVLVGTPWGALCIGVGLALTIVGRVWSSRLVASAGAVR